MKQGPSFILKDHCTGCCFLKTTLTKIKSCELPDYLYEIYVDDHVNLKLCLTKKLK